jgi:sulfur-oxidizing protein SoxY
MDTQRGLHRRGILAAAAFGTIIRPARGQAPPQTDPWPSLAAQIFGERPIADGSSVLAIDAPYRAEDAAVVPITIRTVLPASDKRTARAITLTIDENPSPLAAVFSPGAGSGVQMISTRVRVDSYTNLHATAELDDGRLYASARFVKAAGGCSAPAAKAETDPIPLGTMRFRQFPPARQDGALRQAQLMIRHPNYTGMQMDQLTHLYTPAHFVKSVRIWQGDQLLLAIESGISISENPEFRFDYRANGAAGFSAEVADSTGRTFRQAWPAGGA